MPQVHEQQRQVTAPRILQLAALLFVTACGEKAGLRVSASNPTVCVNFPETWSDKRGISCKEYEKNAFCTKSGGFGEGWNTAWGSFSEVAKEDGITATDSCCVCGGGEIVDTCCQGNKMLEKLKLKLFTKARMLGHLLAAQARGNLSWEVAPVEAKLNASLARQVKSEQSVLAVASERQRAEGVRAARAAFHDLTQHSEKLPEVAQSQMTIAGYEAGRDEVINGSAQIDDIAVHVAAKDATNHFRGTVQAWERLNSEARVAALRGKERMDTYYDLLNSTWTKIGDSVKVLNSAANQSVEPGEKVR